MAEDDREEWEVISNESLPHGSIEGEVISKVVVPEESLLHAVEGEVISKVVVPEESLLHAVEGELAYPEKRYWLVSLAVIILGVFSFSAGGRLIKKDAISQIQSPKGIGVTSLQVEPVKFIDCSMDYQDFTPCTDPMRWRKYADYYRLSFMERHCPPMSERKECIVPPPPVYRRPIRWPKSRDECWSRNVPYGWINNEKANQQGLTRQDIRFLFSGGRAMFPRGVSTYVDLMENLLPGMKDGTIRTAIDTGCGVASWGGHLLDRGILTVSLGPRDDDDAQVQLALERGIPAMLGIISTQRLPFPSNSFDMAHCSQCLIPWTEFDGMYLLEIHRILRPGGFWVLSGPPVYYEYKLNDRNKTMEEQTAVWKSPDNTCYDRLNASSSPPKCDDSMNPDSAWYTPLRACLTVPDPKYHLGLASTPKWPDRLHETPKRASLVPAGDTGGFEHDDGNWKIRVEHYKTLLPVLGTNEIRNVMDMNTRYGGFAAAVIDSPWWVMNVVSSYGPNSLGVIYDRGLIGTYHDWCEPFSTYPRTYDLLHLDGLFTAESHRCEMKYVLLEMDRILRPGGYVIIRESAYFLDAITTIGRAMKWYCKEPKSETDELLICLKAFHMQSIEIGDYANDDVVDTTFFTKFPSKKIVA